MTIGPVSSFPRIVEILSYEDAGALGTCCPHCGADGRYVVWFRTEDGARRGAMRGCFKLFPKSRYATRVERILEKERDARALGRNLASWDRDVLDAIRRLPELGEAEVDRIIARADMAKRNWMVARGYRR